MALSVETLILAQKSAKSYTDEALSHISAGINYKGAVDYYSQLPASPKENDAYTVKYTGVSPSTELDGTEYVWAKYDNTLQWVPFGPDLSQYQKSLVSGTNIKTINNTSVLGSGDINTKEIFYCTYGTTTYAEITQALSDGKIPCCFYSNRCYIYQFTRNDGLYYFSAWDPTLLKDYHLVVQTNNSWGLGNKEAEDKLNKVTSISNASTDTQYPSAKAVYDYAQPTLVSGTNIKTINGNSILGEGNIATPTYTPFKSTWRHDTITHLLADINDDEDAVVGRSYLGEVTTVTAAEGLFNGNAEIFVNIMNGITPYKVIWCTVSSSNVDPYHWEATFINGSISNKGWTGFANTKTVQANPTLAGTESALSGLEVNGTKYKIPSELPSVTSVDAGKFLRVNSSGIWIADTVPSAENQSF